MFTLSVDQATFNDRSQGTTAPFKFVVDCASECFSTYRCRAMKIEQDQSGNFLCKIFNETKNLASQGVSERLYPSPTLNGKYLATKFRPPSEE